MTIIFILAFIWKEKHIETTVLFTNGHIVNPAFLSCILGLHHLPINANF